MSQSSPKVAPRPGLTDKQQALRHAEVLERQAALYKGSPYGDALLASAKLLRDVANAEPVGYVLVTEEDIKRGRFGIAALNEMVPVFQDPLLRSPLEEFGRIPGDTTLAEDGGE